MIYFDCTNTNIENAKAVVQQGALELSVWTKRLLEQDGLILCPHSPQSVFAISSTITINSAVTWCWHSLFEFNLFNSVAAGLQRLTLLILSPANFKDTEASLKLGLQQLHRKPVLFLKSVILTVYNTHVTVERNTFWKVSAKILILTFNSLVDSLRAKTGEVTCI